MSKQSVDTSGIINILDNAGKSIGTGFFASADGCIVTCYHVIKEIAENPAYNQTVKFKLKDSDAICFAKLGKVCAEQDIALLYANPNVIKSAVYYIIQDNLDNGSQLTTMGFPENSKKELYAYPTFVNLINRGRQIQLSNANEITFGFSGAPLLNTFGVAVGMISGISKSENGRTLFLAVGIPSRIIIQEFGDSLNYKGDVERMPLFGSKAIREVKNSTSPLIDGQTKKDSKDKLLVSIAMDTPLESYQLGLSAQAFYELVIEMVDDDLIVNIPDPITENTKIISFNLEGAVVTKCGKAYLDSLQSPTYSDKQKDAIGDVHIVGGSDMTREVFIVHGHDDSLKEIVARVVEKFGLQATILHEKPNEGLTIIQKLEKYANQAGFAIVLMTPDDRGKAKSEKNLKDRARQNVILEWGYFVGKIGASKVCAIHTESIEVPSDISGILHIKYDDKGLWKYQLGKELAAAGYNIDLMKL